MTPQDALALLDVQRPGAAPHALPLDVLLRHLQRSGRLPPPLLALAACLPGLPGLADGADRLLAALPLLASLPAPVDDLGQQLPWAEPPAAQALRVVQALLAGAQGQPLPDASAAVQQAAQQAGLTPAQARHAGRAVAVSARWLADAAQAAAVDAAQAHQGWAVATAQERCRLPLALLGADGQGLAGWLELRRVHHPGAQLCLAPAPASALLLRAGPHWDATLASVHQHLHSLLADVGAGQDTAIAWDAALQPGQPLGQLQGDSAGAALLLGAAWLLRARLLPRWRVLLQRLVAADLLQVACTASLGANGMPLHPVGGVLAKAEGLLPLAALLAAQPGTPRLVLHVSDRQPLPSMPQGVAFQPHASLLALLVHVVDQADPMEQPQLALHTTLCAHDADSPWPQPADDAAAQAWQAQLAAVHQAPARRLRTWLLHCWAEWELDLGGRVQQSHVPLQVKPDALGEGQGQLLVADTSHDHLSGLLARFDSSPRHQAYTLRGAPGAGKSTLLRHHLQRAAQRLLQALGQLLQPAGPQAAHSLPPGVAELPVYIRLGDVPLALGGPGNTPAVQAALWAWLLQHLRQRGAPPELLQLLQGQGEWAALGLRPRLLLDGLNELQVAHPDYRRDRAAAMHGRRAPAPGPPGAGAAGRAAGPAAPWCAGATAVSGGQPV